MRFASLENDWGPGLYFAQTPYLALEEYVHTNSDGQKQVLLANVLVGDTVTKAMDSSIRMPDVKKISADGVPVRYDSVSGKLGTQRTGELKDVVIVYANKHAYPRYLVTFTTA